MTRKTRNFVSIADACIALGCRRDWIEYTISDGLVETQEKDPRKTTDEILVDIKGLQQLDQSEFMVLTELAAARYNCLRQWIDVLIRDQKVIRAYHQGLPGKRPIKLVKLKDLVVLMEKKAAKRKNGA